MTSLESMSEIELLQTHSAVIDELQRRKIVTTRNNPIGDYTEWLVCRCLNLERQKNSKASFDAVDTEKGIRFQIKGRQCDAHRVQFSAIRNLDDRGFDYVIAVVYNRDFTIRFAAKLTHAATLNLSTHRQHVNAHILMLNEACFDVDGVDDIRDLLCG